MALNKKTIKGKIRTAGGIKKTTKTMEMISAVKMRRMTARTAGVRMYARYALELIESISDTRTLHHPLMDKRESGKILLIIIGSNKGLCGGYNVSLSKKLRSFMEKEHLSENTIDAIAVGRQAERIALRAKLSIKASFPGFGEIATPEDVRAILDCATKEFLADKEYKKIMILHTSFVRALEYVPTMRRLLPLSKKMAHDLADASTETTTIPKTLNASLYTFEPSAEDVLTQAVPQLLLATFFEAVLESLASEHGSRMVAMKNATDNASAMQAELTLWYNKARQASITQEIAEISGGAGAQEQAMISI